MNPRKIKKKKKDDQAWQVQDAHTKRNLLYF